MTGAFLSAVLTGVFCAVFAVVVNFFLPPLMGFEVPVIALISGFLGSLFARYVLKRKI